MTQRSRLLHALSIACVLAACSKPEEGGEVPSLVATATSPSVRADGVASVRIHIEGGAPGEVVVSTNRGHLGGGQTQISIPATPADVTLRTCNSAADPSCAGFATVTVLDSALTRRTATVEFLPVEVCNDGVNNGDGDALVDCADPECGAGVSCNAFGRTCGTGGACSECDGQGGTAEPLGETTCFDGRDNDCDGRVDCQDSDCTADVCTTTDFRNGNYVLGACTGVGAAAQCRCTAAATGETGAACGNGLDDDCDGLVDCEDNTGTATAPTAHCQPSGSSLGGICQAATGLTCSSRFVTGASECTVCSGNGGTIQITEANCADGKDNDCDGQVDCQDPNCASLGYVCDATGKTCDTASFLCVCNKAEAQTGELSCGDGDDNDCDGKIDCADPDCQGTSGTPVVGRACGANSRFCVGTGTAAKCECRPPNGTAAQATETTCNDGVDNDCDGQLDCADATCLPALAAQYGGVCDSTPVMGGYKCDVYGACACTGNGGVAQPAGETACTDGKDNDCDKTTDCADASCDGQACTASGKAGMLCGAGTCSVCGGNGGAAQPVGETLCSDGFDNDCDTKADCADTQCTGKSCTALAIDGVTPTIGKCAAGGACTCTPVAEAPNNCDDGVDNDCDGRIDCRDPDCQGDGINPGKICDANGFTCTAPVGGVSACGTLCSGNGGAPQDVETSCFDGADNDCNGVKDCLDPSCAMNKLSCSTTGKTCSDSGSGVCVCESPEAGGEETCGDGADNDCDGLIDCKDPNCNTTAATCGPNGMACTTASGGTCACSGNGGVKESPKELTCTDGVDNDCDGAADCVDIDCRPTVAGAFGKGCGGTNEAFFGFKCDFIGGCVCSRGEEFEATCGDLQDNDCDGAVDCADPDCQPNASGVLGAACTTNGTTWTGLSCADTGTCSVCSGNGGTPEGTEASCADGYDNDCDGNADCAESGCLGQLCLLGSANHECTMSEGTAACLDTTSTFTLTVTAAQTRLAANGTATTTITATLKDLVAGTLQPQPAKAITFAVSGNGTTSPAGGTTNSSGQTTTTFTSSALGGPATVIATFDTGTQLITGSVVIDQPELGQLKLVSTQYQVMGARYSGFQETNVLTFQALDTANNPYPAGLAVDFSHQSLGASYLGTTETCVAGPPRICTGSAATDAAGKVQILLHSGTVAGVVAVSATSQAGGGLGEAQASNLAVVGAKASGARISLNCTPYNVPGFTNHDCTVSKYGGQDSQVNCTVALADRFNNVLGVTTLATFRSEAGSAGPPASTPAYDPTKAPTAQPNLGRAANYVAVTGYKLPLDVAPDPGELPAGVDPLFDSGCGSRTHNPRDGLSTILVAVNGEEGFVDGSNGCPADGRHQRNGDVAGCTGEYFVDMGEPFVDSNDNGQWDNGEDYVDVDTDGTRDPPNGLWDENTVIWAEARVVYSGWATSALNGSQQEIRSRFFQAGAPPAPTPIQSYTVLAANTQVQPNLPAQGTFAIAYFTDANFNQPTSRTAYALAQSGPITTKWLDAPNTVDNLGMGLRQLYCSVRTPTDVSTQCADTCQASSADPNVTTPEPRAPRCFVVTTISGYSYGTIGTVEITPSSGAGPGRVTATATFNNVANSVHITGNTFTQP